MSSNSNSFPARNNLFSTFVTRVEQNATHAIFGTATTRKKRQLVKTKENNKLQIFEAIWKFKFSV